MVRRKNRFDLGGVYRDSWNYLKESKNFIFIIIGIFVLFSLFGFFVPAPEEITSEILKFIRELLEITEGMSFFEITSFLFFNNLRSSFLGLAFGILLGIFPIFSAISNGYILGFVASMSVDQYGFFVLWRLVPHGIFELPAIFISLGMGLRLGINLVSKRKKGELKNNFVRSLKTFLSIVIPLLVIAAIIEGFLISFSG